MRKEDIVFPFLRCASGLRLTTSASHAARQGQEFNVHAGEGRVEGREETISPRNSMPVVRALGVSKRDHQLVWFRGVPSQARSDFQLERVRACVGVSRSPYLTLCQPRASV